jgi:hypothetical protein
MMIDFDKFFGNLFDNEEIEKVLHEQHRDTVTKEIGDRVAVIDFSSITRHDGSDIAYDEDMVFDDFMYFVVIETRQNSPYKCGILNYNQDVVIANPKNNMIYRAFSGHLTIKK